LPLEFTYFTDVCLGNKLLPQRLRDEGLHVVTHAEFGLAPDERDVDWIPKVALKGYVILTKDRNIRRLPLELRVVLQERARYFVLGNANRTAEHNAAIILKHRHRIKALVRDREPPIVAQLNADEVLVRTEDGKLVRFAPTK